MATNITPKEQSIRQAYDDGDINYDQYQAQMANASKPPLTELERFKEFIEACQESYQQMETAIELAEQADDECSSSELRYDNATSWETDWKELVVNRLGRV